MENPFDVLIKAMMPEGKLFKIAAIWMERPVTFESGYRTRRLSAGMRIRVVDGLVADSGEATHYIEECWGTLSDSELWFELYDLKNDDQLKLRIK